MLGFYSPIGICSAFGVQQILVVTFEFTGAAHSFMIMSCAAHGVKKVGQHCTRPRLAECGVCAYIGPIHVCVERTKQITLEKN